MTCGFKQFIGVVSLAACAMFATQSQAGDKVLKVGCEPTFPPFEFLDDNAQPIGYDIDIIKAIGEAEGVEIEVVTMPFDGLIPALITAQLDASISGITITEERAKKVDFTEPYYDSGLSAVILSENKEKFKKISDLSKSRICSQIGTTGAAHAQKISGNVASFNTNPEAFMELRAKGCDAVLLDKPVNGYFLSKSKAGEYFEIPEILDAEQYGIAVKKGNKEVSQILNSGLEKIHKNGKFDEIYNKWFSAKE